MFPLTPASTGVALIVIEATPYNIIANDRSESSLLRQCLKTVEAPMFGSVE